jgi:predicted MFS family arabinose efflux permease
MRRTLVFVPLLLGVLAFALTVFGRAIPVACALVALWGFAFGIVPVGWSTWFARTVHDEPETGGALLVAAAQVAITIGAFGGGIAFDLGGSRGALVLGGMVLAAASPIALGSQRAWSCKPGAVGREDALACKAR